MAIKDYKRGMGVKLDQDHRHTRFNLFPDVKVKGWTNPWFNRQKHPGWAAYHANKDKK